MDNGFCNHTKKTQIIINDINIANEPMLQYW